MSIRGSSGIDIAETNSPISTPVAAVMLSNSFIFAIVLITGGGLPALEQTCSRELLLGDSDW